MFKSLGLLISTAAFLLALTSRTALADQVHAAWVPTWYASPEPSPNAKALLNNQTVRQIVHVSAGGKQVRIRLSNAFGGSPLHIDTVSIARRAAGSAVQAGSIRTLRFSGHADVTVAPGAYAVSDPLYFDVPAATDLAISLYVSGPTSIATTHLTQRNAIYFSDGDTTSSETITETHPDTGTWASWLWLSEVEVSGAPVDGVVIAFGDSITDGLALPGDSNSDWPSVLSDHLRKAGKRLSVVNAGITGNRLLHNGQWAPFGIAGLARFDSDVLAQPNAKAVIVFLGINDIGQAKPGSSEFVTGVAIEDGLTQLAERAHEKGLKIYAVTLAPFKDAIVDGYYSDEKDATRQAVNEWIRSSRLFDGVADAAKALDDPENPGRMLPAYDSGDHLHPSAAGAAAIAAGIPLAWFRVR
ncbi:MAG: GDSL-type esterase/lipase family protein [Sphingomonas bacterium]